MNYVTPNYNHPALSNPKQWSFIANTKVGVDPRYADNEETIAVDIG